MLCWLVGEILALAVLFPTMGIVSLILLPALRWLVGLIHETGHAAMACLLGWRVTMIMVRPLRLRLSPLRMDLLREHSLWALGTGRAEYIPDRRPATRRAWVTAAGAGANLLTFGVLLAAPRGATVSLDPVQIAFLILSCASAGASLLPYPGSDGRELARLRRAARLRVPRRSTKSRP